MRYLAAICFAVSAFAWLPPHIDRAGAAALGAAFLALTVAGRSRVRPVTPRPPWPFVPAAGDSPASRDLTVEWREMMAAQAAGAADGEPDEFGRYPDA